MTFGIEKLLFLSSGYQIFVTKYSNSTVDSSTCVGGHTNTHGSIYDMLQEQICSLNNVIVTDDITQQQNKIFNEYSSFCNPERESIAVK